MTHAGIRKILTGFAFGVLLATTTVAGEPPDSELNLVTGYIESVDAPADTGSLVRHVEDAGQGGSRTVTTISSQAARGPRIAVQVDGDTWTVWWQDLAVDEVRFTVRDLASGSWSTEKLVSDPTEDSRYPKIVHADDDSTAWIAYQIASGSETQVAAVGISDSPEPFGRTVIATTTATGMLDLEVHAEQGNAWVTWVDTQNEVGWSAWDAASGSWGLAAYESYAGSDVATARATIRATVLGP